MTWAAFERHLRAKGSEPATIQSYREPAGQLADCCKGSDLLVLDRGDTETFLIEVRGLHSPSTELDSLGIQRQDRPGAARMRCATGASRLPGATSAGSPTPG